MIVNVSVTFKGGGGILTATVFSNGIQICNGQTFISGKIILPSVSQGDTISIDGVSPTEGTDIIIDVPTGPPTPDHYYAGPIMCGYIVL